MNFRLNTLLLLILISSSGCSLFPEADSEPESPIPGKIVFSMPQGEGESYQIFVMNPNGSGLKQLTNLGEFDAINPSWNPDGTKIVFTTGKRGTVGNPAIHIMNADGSNIQPMKVFPGRPDLAYPGRYPTWSPDGSKIAYHQCIGCGAAGGNNYEIFVYDFLQDTVIQITDHPAIDQFPDWSPDGNELIFITNRDNNENNLYKIFLGEEITKEPITTAGNVSTGVINYSENSLLIRTLENPINWYSIHIASKDTLPIENLKNNINTFEYIPVKWSDDSSFLMLLQLDFPEYHFSFFEVKATKLVSGSTYNNLSGYDWYYNETSEQ